MTNNDTTTAGQKVPSIFSQLVVMLATSTLQAMGKLVNPMTQKTEMNLQAASATIDLLDMLQQKTQGNLDTDEEHLLTDTLASLKMNYVETAKSAEEASDQEETPAADNEEKTPDVPDEKNKDPKFHKTYE